MIKYRIEITPSALRPIKGQSREFKEQTYREVQILAQNPFAHERLGSPLATCRSYHFNYKGSAFRIAYTTNKKEKKIVIVLIGSRENFYRRLLRKLR